MPEHPAPRLAVALLLACPLACRIEPLHELDTGDDPGIATNLLPTIPAIDRASEPTVGWEAMVRQHLAFLAGPLAAGRRPGTDGARVTQRLTSATFSEAGLSPDGVDRTWTQAVPLEIVTNHRVRITTEWTNADSDERSSFALDTGIAIRRDGISTPYRARLSLVTIARERLQADPVELPEAVAGKLVLAALRPEDTAEAILEQGLAVFAAARRRGAVGCLLALPPTPHHATILERWNVAEVRVRTAAPAEDALAFYGFIDGATHEVLDAAREAAAPVEVTIESEARSLDDANVIGRIPGDEDPGHVVMVTAHWDAGALSPPIPKGGGAIDNATGLASLLAMAEISGRWFALGRRPRRSLVFAATAAGSLGHFGGGQVLALPGLAPSNLVAVINLERLDWRGTTLVALDGDVSSLGADLRELVPDLVLQNDRATWGHDAFLDTGVPAVTLHRPSPSDPLGDPDSWGSLDRLAHDAELAFRLAWALAEGNSVPFLARPPSDPIAGTAIVALPPDSSAPEADDAPPSAADPESPAAEPEPRPAAPPPSRAAKPARAPAPSSPDEPARAPAPSSPDEPARAPAPSPPDEPPSGADEVVDQPDGEPGRP